MAAEYLKRWLRCMGGLFLCGSGTYLTLQAVTIGVGAWETFQTGLSMRLGISYGNCSVMVSVFVIMLDLILKGKIGFGTISNAIMMGKVVDLWRYAFDVVPQATTVPIGILYIFIGQVIIAIGAVIYMKEALGCGPRDTLMVVLGRRFPNVNIGIVRFCIESVVFVMGVLLGAPYGWGTVFAMACTSYVMQRVFKLCHFSARDLQHENIPDSIRRLRGQAMEIQE